MKKFFMIMLVFSLIIVTPTFAFSDVTEAHWAHDKIQEMYQSGIISGFENGTFKPNDPITREQAAAVMSNFFEISLKENAKEFQDVAIGYWSEQYVKLISQFMPIDVVDGKNYFRPFDNATRIELAETIVKIIGYDSENVDEEIIEKFNDKSVFSEKDNKYISIVAKNGIMVGDDNSEFRPNDTITRAEFCALIYNIYLMRDELKAQNSAKVVMTINGEALTYDEFNLYFNLQRKVYESMFGSSEIWTTEIDGMSLYEIVKESTKDGISEDKIKLQKAKELNIELTDEVKEEIQEYANSETGMGICEFYNITSDQLIKINSEGKLIDELLVNVYNSLDHSNHQHLDINAPVDTVKYNARHILLSTEGLTDEDKAKVKEAAEALLGRVKNGEDFATLAKEYSVDGGSKDNGGLYEDISLGEFVSEFETAALSLSDGMIYPELVESAYGYHIIKLESKINTVRDLTDSEKEEIMSGDLTDVIQEWINNSKIEVNEAVYKML